MQESFIWIIGSVLCAFVMWAAQVSPKQAVSNVAEWAITLGVKNPPDWLKSPDADFVVKHFAKLILCAFIAIGFWQMANITNAKFGPKLLFGLGCAFIFSAICWSYYLGTNTPSAKKDAQAIRVTLLPGPGQLQLHNQGAGDILLWGTKTEGYPPDFTKDVQIIYPNNYYYIMTDALERIVITDVGQNGEKLYGMEYFFKDISGRKQTGIFKVLAVAKEGKVSFHTQQLGIIDGWTVEPSAK